MPGRNAFALLSTLWTIAIALQCGGATARGATILVGDYRLMPNTPSQTIAVLVVGGELISGVDLFVQVGDGGPELSEFGLPAGTAAPTIRKVELTRETVFQGVTDMAMDIGSPLLDQVALYTLALVGAIRQVPAQGTLARLSMDTTGLYAGEWPLLVSGVLPFTSLGGPYTTNFAGQAAVAIRNGSIRIATAPLEPGDANRDLRFDQMDVVQVLVGGTYRTGRAATWGEGDWNGAPGGSPDRPPAGDGVFDQEDIVAALRLGHYRAGPYAALPAAGGSPDGPSGATDDADGTSVSRTTIGGGIEVGTASLPWTVGASEPLAPGEFARGRALPGDVLPRANSGAGVAVPEPSTMVLAVVWLLAATSWALGRGCRVA